jgi:hypothetical protein
VLVQVAGVYCFKDGHQRIWTTQALGQSDIQAKANGHNELSRNPSSVV